MASADLDSEVEDIEVSSPYIVVSSTDDSREYFIVVEKMTWWKAATWQVLFKIWCLFINIAYPTNLPVLLFLQHHVFEIRNNQPVPNIVKNSFFNLWVRPCSCNIVRHTEKIITVLGRGMEEHFRGE